MLGKGLTFDFFSDSLVRKAILVTAQCADSIITFSSTHGKDTILPRRNTWTAKILPATDDRLAFSKVKDADGKMVGPAFKTMKSEFVAWQEAIRAKKYDLHDEKQHDQPEGAFTERNTNRYQQTWVKTFMQDVRDEKGQVLFDNLAWFAKKLCSVMTSASACEHMWSIEGWIHNKRRNRLAQPNVERAVRAHGNLVLRKAMLLSKQQKVAWDSQTRISEPDRRTNEQGVDDSDDDDIDSDASTARQDQH